MIGRKPFTIMLLLTLFASTAHAGTTFHKWRDAKGVWHFSDEKPEGIRSERGTIQTGPSAFSIERAELEPSTSRARRHKIVMYSTTRCGHCNEARAFMNRKRIPFTEYDVERSAKGRRDHERLGGGGVPLILVGKEKMRGFTEKALMRLLRK